MFLSILEAIDFSKMCNKVLTAQILTSEGFVCGLLRRENGCCWCSIFPKVSDHVCNSFAGISVVCYVGLTVIIYDLCTSVRTPVDVPSLCDHLFQVRSYI